MSGADVLYLPAQHVHPLAMYWWWADELVAFVFNTWQTTTLLCAAKMVLKKDNTLRKESLGWGSPQMETSYFDSAMSKKRLQRIMLYTTFPGNWQYLMH